MASLSIRPVESKSDRKAFVDFAWEVYRDDPAWIPPLKDAERDGHGGAGEGGGEQRHIAATLEGRFGRGAHRHGRERYSSVSDSSRNIMLTA